ncbi:hypothetical protein [Ornithinibacillus scapharcae]|uniref:hypothetical protein n=1 Tax=Ornithinibacillus scapharcae TaxID=1147159 RepID=UPI000225AA6B|nr:hypothetical protein [Ornithinibacillus scapharcae]
MSSITTTKVTDSEATYLTITPVVSLYKIFSYDSVERTISREFELIKDPFMLDPIVVPLRKEDIGKCYCLM